MPCPPCDFYDQAIGESQLRALAKAVERSRHDFGLLEREIAMREKDLDGCRNFRRRLIVDRGQYPHGLDENQVRHPGTSGDESFGCLGLAFVVARDQANQDIGVNRAHVVS